MREDVITGEMATAGQGRFVILKIKWRRFLSGKWRSLSGLRGHGRVESAFASVNHPVRFAVVILDLR
jgi:hypothetical protein